MDQRTAWLKENFGPSVDVDELMEILEFIVLQHQGPLLGQGEEKQQLPTTVRLTPEDHRMVSIIVDQRLDPRFRTKSDLYTHFISLGVNMTMKLYDLGAFAKSYEAHMAKTSAVEWARSVKREMKELNELKDLYDEIKSDPQSLQQLRSSTTIFMDNTSTDTVREQARQLVEKIEDRLR